MKRIFVTVMIMACVVGSFAATYVWGGSQPIRTPVGLVQPGDTVYLDAYYVGRDTTGWELVNYQNGINPFYESTILRMTAGDWDTVDVTEEFVDHIDVICSDSVAIYLNDTTGINPIMTAEYWAEDVNKTVARLIFHALGAVPVVEVHAFERSFQ